MPAYTHLSVDVTILHETAGIVTYRHVKSSELHLAFGFKLTFL